MVLAPVFISSPGGCFRPVQRVEPVLVPIVVQIILHVSGTETVLLHYVAHHVLVMLPSPKGEPRNESSLLSRH